jgi:hypothetical protein
VDVHPGPWISETRIPCYRKITIGGSLFPSTNVTPSHCQAVVWSETEPPSSLIECTKSSARAFVSVFSLERSSIDPHVAWTKEPSLFMRGLWV